MSCCRGRLTFLGGRNTRFTDGCPGVTHHLKCGGKISRSPRVRELARSFTFLDSEVRRELSRSLPRLVRTLLHGLTPRFLCRCPSSYVTSFRPSEGSDKVASPRGIPSNAAVCSGRGSRAVYRFQAMCPLAVIPTAIGRTEVCCSGMSSL